LTQLNAAFTAALSTAAEQRSRTTKFFADELKTLKSSLVVQRQLLYDAYSNAEIELQKNDIRIDLPEAEEEETLEVMDHSTVSQS